jgi:hypothetical protein
VAQEKLAMPENHDVIDILKRELEFLESGGYRRSPRQPWRAGCLFEDSPICVKRESNNHPAACSECVLLQFVPAELRDEPNPCRFIRLTPSGETPNSMYGYADQHEIEDALRKWLRLAIAGMEAECLLQEAAQQPWV